MNRAVASLAIVAALLPGCAIFAQDPAPMAFDATARQTPFLSVAPELDEQAAPGEWDLALTLNGTFSIQDKSPAAGEYPFELRLGHNDKFLFGWLVVHDIPPDPFYGHPNPTSTHGDQLGIFLDTKLGPKLEPWESYKESVFVEGLTDSADGYWDGGDWATNPNMGSNNPWDGNRPTSGTWLRGWANESGENQTDVNWEFYIPLKPNHDHDDFHLGPNGVFRMCLLFDVQGGSSPDARGRFKGPHDTFPGDGYTPNGHYDPSSWLRLQLA